MARPPTLNRRVLALEATIFAVAVLYYELGTFLFRADPGVANANAVRLWHLEQQLHLFVEPQFQAAFSAVPLLLWVLIIFYVGPHFGLTLGFFGWSYWWRFPSYPDVRNSFLAFTVAAFGFQWLVPVSPPRYIHEAGLADSIDQHLPVSGETPWIQRLTNPYAALPSVHFGWAFLVAYLAIRLTRGPNRILWALYPLGIGLSILATGNHWVLDLALSAVFLLGVEAALGLQRRHWHILPSSAPAVGETSAA